MASRNDEGQIILLAGILLVIAFIAFSIQLSVLPNLGQQLGRETENPLLEDYLLVKRTFETLLPDELRSATDRDDVVCLHGFDFLQRVRGQLTLFTALEGTRGQSFGWDRLEVERMGGTTTDFEVRITLRLSDGATTLTEKVTYPVECNTGTATGCSPACVATP